MALDTAKERELKRAKLESTGSFHIQAQAITDASYALSYRIARDKKPHTIGQTLVKPCVLECTKIILGNTAAQKIADLSLSDSTVKSRIDDMSADIKRQVTEKIRSSPMIVIQLDESTDVASISQLMMFARYVHRKTIKEEFLFCSPLTETTTAADVMNLVSDFFSKEHLDWGKLIGVCTDGAPAMLGCRTGFAQLVRKKNPSVVEGFHQCLAYLVDIFGSIDEVNTKMQGRDKNMLNVTDSINAFKDKLKLWVERLATGNVWKRGNGAKKVKNHWSRGSVEIQLCKVAMYVCEVAWHPGLACGVVERVSWNVFGGEDLIVSPLHFWLWGVADNARNVRLYPVARILL
ncbi:protein FAM200C-like [Watersipora subatra]|uniref:protein FAM200C-like n=1 Tax=Watersipora subatra TaxID=2589382 RepID=UPI00355C5084